MALSTIASQFLGAKLVAKTPEVAVAARDVTVRALFKKSGGTKKVGGGSSKPQVSKTSRSQDVYGRELWLPNFDPPEWLDGTLIGDRGFDPLGFSKPPEYLQVELDDLEQNDAVNKAGDVIGEIKISGVEVDSGSLQPYTDVFDITRFRENELIHGRWAMLAVLGALVSELATGVSWIDAIKVELDSPSYFGLPLPFSTTQLSILNSVLIGGAELYRNTETDLEKRQYPGGPFDPLNLASDPERANKLKEAEIKHARLAMIAALGFAAQAAFSGSFSPLDNLTFLENQL